MAKNSVTMAEAKWPSSFIDHYTGIYTPDTQSIYALDEMTAYDMSFDRAKLILKEGEEEETEPQYPTGLTLSFVLVALLMAMFLVCIRT